MEESKTQNEKNNSVYGRSGKFFKVIAVCSALGMFFLGVTGIINLCRFNGAEIAVPLMVIKEILRLCNKIVWAVSFFALARIHKKYIPAGVLCLIQGILLIVSSFVTNVPFRYAAMCVGTLLLMAFNIIYIDASQVLFDQIDGSLWDSWYKLKKRYIFVWIVIIVFALFSIIPGLGLFCLVFFALGVLYCLFLSVLMIIYSLRSAKSIQKHSEKI
ncbi:MAG: hypothetical protein J5840_04205 [Lachnospiraceae bacterium]|nr:hypothetical protein [Lachnospiraceae bacterium]